MIAILSGLEVLMKIQATRTAKANELIFTIRVTTPHDSQWGNVEMGMFKQLDKMDRHQFERFRAYLVSTIENEMHEKCLRIKQEMYNWIYDNQHPDLRRIFHEHDPQRTKYYFDNDITVESCSENTIEDPYGC